MKKQYKQPEVEALNLAVEQALLEGSNGEDLGQRNYGSGSGENASDFWG